MGGGGGSGFGFGGGAGGAGGLVYVSNYAAAANTAYGVTVGNRGPKMRFGGSNNSTGGNSVFDSGSVHQILTGNGGGGGGEATAYAGGSGVVILKYNLDTGVDTVLSTNEGRDAGGEY